MQQIERYGVIALVFLLVTIVAVSFWGDGKSPGFWARLTGKGAKKDPAAASVAQLPAPPANVVAERAIGEPLPLSPVGGTLVPGAASAPLTTPLTTPLAPGGQPTPSIAQLPPPVTRPAPLSLPDPAPVTVKPAARGVEYLVQSGDTLGGIAQKTLGTSGRWREIQALNGNLDPKNLHVGTKLVLPSTARVPAAQPVAASVPASGAAAGKPRVR